MERNVPERKSALLCQADAGRDGSPDGASLRQVR
jgi:hypothetical protein